MKCLLAVTTIAYSRNNGRGTLIADWRDTRLKINSLLLMLSVECKLKLDNDW